MILLLSCHTVKYSLTEYNETFRCKYDTCFKGVVPCEVDIYVLFSKILIKNKKIYAEGVAKDPDNRCNFPFLKVNLGEKTTDGKILLQKRIIVVNREDCGFKFKIKLKEGKFIVFNSLGYRPKIYQLTPIKYCP